MFNLLSHCAPKKKCCISVAFYLFARFHSNKEGVPNVADELREWYDIYLLNGKSKTAPMSYTANRAGLKKGFDAVGISSTKITHANRKGGANSAKAMRAEDSSIRKLGGWSIGVMEDCYIQTMPLENENLTRHPCGVCSRMFPIVANDTVLHRSKTVALARRFPSG